MFALKIIDSEWRKRREEMIALERKMNAKYVCAISCLIITPFNHFRDTTSKLSEIINDMGEASARAQGLTRPVTTAQKLRNSEHTVYLMHEKGGKK